MFRITLVCDGVPQDMGVGAAQNIENEFKKIRTPRYINAVCRFDAGQLVLSCDNDGWDRDGLGLMDEFSDCLSAYLPPFDGDMRFVSSIALNKS